MIKKTIKVNSFYLLQSSLKKMIKATIEFHIHR